MGGYDHTSAERQKRYIARFKERIDALERENGSLRAELERVRKTIRPKKNDDWITRAANRAEAMPRARTLVR